MRYRIVFEIRPGVFLSYRQFCHLVWTLPRHQPARGRIDYGVPICGN